MKRYIDIIFNNLIFLSEIIFSMSLIKRNHINDTYILIKNVKIKFF